MAVVEHSSSRSYRKTRNLIVRRLVLNLLKILRISNGNGILTEPDSDSKGCKGEIHENSQRRTADWSTFGGSLGEMECLIGYRR